MRFRFLVLCFGFLLFAGSAANAQEYIKPSWPNLLKTLVRFNALDLFDDKLVDEYAIVTECDLYKNFYANDFKWNQVRQAVRKSANINIATYPTSYAYDLPMQLDRYDFVGKTFKFREKSMLRNVNTFVLYAVDGTKCGAAEVKIMPRSFRAVLSTPVFLEGFPMPEADARAFLARMEKENNPNRIVYARFNLSVVYIEALRQTARRTALGGETVMVYEQDKAGKTGGFRVDARLDSIGFYEDEAMTRMVFQYQP